jgi:cellulose synthase/poly-beta-1,6-N-acetylglucosamine synthase-like glycosyltransferase
MVVIVLQIWVSIVVVIMIVYGVRHWLFTRNRMLGTQRPFYQELYDNDPPPLTIIIPMHNEAAVAANVLEAIIRGAYPLRLLEIIPVDDHSEDNTKAILLKYSQSHDFIKPLYITNGLRGKANALNHAMRVATHDIVLVFDADYIPSAGLLRELAMAFIDPEVGAVMGRVVPKNTSENLLTRLLSLERTGGYQVDQQARYNLDLFPQYGGTVGGFRRKLVLDLGGFDTNTLAEDTDLTARLFIAGWKVMYANRAECYEEVPNDWTTRFRQLRRWSRGHNRALFRNMWPLIASKRSSGIQKLDGMLLLGIYMIPIILLSGLAANTALFLMGAIPIWAGLILSLFVVAYNAFGNFAPIYEVGAGELLDGSVQRIYLLPFLFALFLFNSWAVTTGIVDAIGDAVKKRYANWDKTKRGAARTGA